MKAVNKMKTKISFFILIILIIKLCCSAAVDNNAQLKLNQTITDKETKPNGKISFLELEKEGKKPEENFKLIPIDKTELLVEITEKNDYDNNLEIITNKSKILITWKYYDFKNPNKTITLPTKTNNSDVKNFSIYLMYNVTKDYEIDKYYNVIKNETLISNVNDFTYEYKIPRLDENYIYNIVVTNENILKTSRDIGISKTFIYKLYQNEGKGKNNEDSESSINPIFIVVGVGAIILVIGLAFLISKKMTNKEEKKSGNDSSQIYNTSLDGKVNENKEDNQMELDNASVFTNDTGEVSWSNLEIAKTSQQTKNANNEKIVRTLDKKGYKRETKSNKFEYENESTSYKVIRIFNPSQDDEIELNIGDDVEITTIFEDGWCEGINKSNNQTGVFPRSCVIEEEMYQDMLNNKSNTSSSLPDRRRSKRLSVNGNNSFYFGNNDFEKNEIIPEIVDIQNIQ